MKVYPLFLDEIVQYQQLQQIDGKVFLFALQDDFHR
jgi:hypothetical protein